MTPSELFLRAMDLITLLIGLSPIAVTFAATLYLHRRSHTVSTRRLAILAGLWLACAAVVRSVHHPVFHGDEASIDQAHRRIAVYSWEVAGLHVIEYSAFLAFAVALLTLFRARGQALRGENI